MSQTFWLLVFTCVQLSAGGFGDLLALGGLRFGWFPLHGALTFDLGKAPVVGAGGAGSLSERGWQVLSGGAGGLSAAPVGLHPEREKSWREPNDKAGERRVRPLTNRLGIAWPLLLALKEELRTGVFGVSPYVRESQKTSAETKGLLVITEITFSVKSRSWRTSFQLLKLQRSEKELKLSKCNLKAKKVDDLNDQNRSYRFSKNNSKG